jgi:hypothetical protein
MKPFIILATIFAVCAGVVVAINVFGDGEWDRNQTEVVTTQSGETVVITNGGWHGPPFGLLFIPLIIFGLFWAFGGRRGRGCDPHDRNSGDRAQLWSDWHRAEHERMAAATRANLSPPPAERMP